MGVSHFHKCPECDQEMVRIFDYYLCNSCDIVRDVQDNILLKTYLWKPECIRVKYDFLYTVLLAQKGKATLEDILKQVERRPLEYGCDESVGMPLTLIPPPEPTKEEQELYEKFKEYQKQGLSNEKTIQMLRKKYPELCDKIINRAREPRKTNIYPRFGTEEEKDLLEEAFQKNFKMLKTDKKKR